MTIDATGMTPEQMVDRAHKLAEDSLALRRTVPFVYDTASARAMVNALPKSSEAYAEYARAYEVHQQADALRDEATELIALSKGNV